MRNQENIKKGLKNIFFSIENNFLHGEHEILIVRVHLIGRDHLNCNKT